MPVEYPSIVVQNHRYRGPHESRKTNDFMRDVTQSIERLKRAFNGNEEHLSVVRNDINMMDNEEGNLYKQRRVLEVKLESMKGGEMK